MLNIAVNSLKYLVDLCGWNGIAALWIIREMPLLLSRILDLGYSSRWRFVSIRRVPIRRVLIRLDGLNKRLSGLSTIHRLRRAIERGAR